MTITRPAVPDAPGLAPNPDDPEALIKRACQHVTAETVPQRRKAVLIAAGTTLGKEPRVNLEAAGPALYAATRFARYPDVLDGEDIARIIRRSLAAGRQHSAGYGDGTVTPPTAPPAPEAAAAAPAPGPADAAVAATADPPPASEVPAADPQPAPDVFPVEVRPDPEPAPPATSDSVLQRADALAPAPVDWLWKNHIARGKLTLIGGAPGSGKSTLALGLIAAVSSGGAWPGDEGRAAQGSAILVCEQAGVRDTIVPGLIAAGADRSRIGLIADVPEEGGRRRFNLHTDLALLENAIQSLPDVRLIVIDPVNAFAGADAGREDRLGALLHPLAALAEKHQVAIVVIAHPVKGNYLKPNVTGIGALALNAAARTSFLVHPDPIDPRRRLLMAVKTTSPATAARSPSPSNVARAPAG